MLPTQIDCTIPVASSPSVSPSELSFKCLLSREVHLTRTFKLPSGNRVLKVPINFRQLSSKVASSGPYHLLRKQAFHQRQPGATTQKMQHWGSYVNARSVNVQRGHLRMALLPGSDPQVKHSCSAFSSFSFRPRKLPLFLFMTSVKTKFAVTPRRRPSHEGH